MSQKQSIGIGLMGLGVVGGGVAQVLLNNANALSHKVGCPLTLRRVLVRDLSRPRSAKVAPDLVITDPKVVLNDPGVDIVVEVMGGEHPALEYMEEALRRGKHVVTANKEVLSKHGPRLVALAQQQKVDIHYEASVGGGIPIIASLKQDLIANHIATIYAIINGTTNYILTRMAKEGTDFNAALKQAQKLGYAEADPTNDIEGIDAAYKLAILATLAFNVGVGPQDVYREGISRLSSRDFRYAREFGYSIKLLAIAKETDGAIEARVHPALVPEDFLLAQVDGVFNAIQVEGDLVGRLLFYGRGAGAQPTASAVVADVIDIAQNIHLGASLSPMLRLEPGRTIKPMADVETRYYLRMNVADQPGVLAQISKALGDNNISIASVIQKEVDPSAKAAEIVIMTHPAKESAMQSALKEMKALKGAVREISNFIRVEG